MANPVETDDETIQKQLDEAYHRFIDKFGAGIAVDTLVIDTEYFEDFEKDLLDLNIVPQKSMGEIRIKTKRGLFWRRLFSRRRRKKK